MSTQVRFHPGLTGNTLPRVLVLKFTTVASTFTVFYYLPTNNPLTHTYILTIYIQICLVSYHLLFYLLTYKTYLLQDRLLMKPYVNWVGVHPGLSHNTSMDGVLLLCPRKNQGHVPCRNHGCVKLWCEAVLPSLAFNCAECWCILKCRKKHVGPKSGGCESWDQKRRR